MNHVGSQGPGRVSNLSRREVDVKSYNNGAPKFIPSKKANALKLDTIDKPTQEESKTIEEPAIIAQTPKEETIQPPQIEEVKDEPAEVVEKGFVYSDVESTSEEELPV